MRIVITGATGNVGAALLRVLGDRRPDDSLIGLARRVPDPVAPYTGASWVSVDLASDASEAVLAEQLSGADAVVHLAVAFQPMRDRGYLRRVNVGGTERVARACAKAGVKLLVHMSSGGVYASGAYGREVDEQWPRTGVLSSTYSVDKAAAERVLDEFEASHPDVAVARLRPGMIGQYEFGSAALRYALPDLVPSSVIDRIPLLPIDRSFTIPAVHSHDVADAIVRVLDRRASGVFNISAPTPVRSADVADALGARVVPTPVRVLSTATRLAFAAHLAPVHHGWVDLAFTTPLLDTTRVREELDWTPSMDGPAVLRETVRGMRDRAHAAGPPLRERTVADRLRSFGRGGPIGTRKPS